MTAEQDAKASNMDSPNNTAVNNPVSGEVRQEQVAPTAADLDKVHDGRLSMSTPHDALRMPSDARYGFGLFVAPYTLPLDPQAEQLLPNEIMAHIYSFCRQSTLLNCLTASQLQFDLAARKLYRHMSTQVLIKRGSEKDPYYWGNHFLFSEDRNTRNSVAQRLRDQTYRSAIWGLRDLIKMFLDAKESPDFEFLIRYLPNTRSYSWTTSFFGHYKIRRDESGNWTHVSLEVESPCEFIECGGPSYTRHLIANMKTPLTSLELLQGNVDPEDFSDDEDAMDNQREWAELISELSTCRDDLKRLKICASTRAPESDVHLLHSLMSSSLVELNLSVINGAELEMILSWDVPQLRRIEVTLEAQTD